MPSNLNSGSKNLTYVDFVADKILRHIFISNISFNSNLVRSPKFSFEQICVGFRDGDENVVREALNKLEHDYLIIKLIDERGNTVYTYNPNKGRSVDHLYTNSLTNGYSPIESTHQGFLFIFEKYSAPNSKTCTVYKYYRHEHDKLFLVEIQNKDGGRSRTINLGLISDKSSIIGNVVAAMNKLPTKFTKVQLEQSISDRRITQNRQPLRAALDILEYLEVISKTGKKVNRSEEFIKKKHINVDSLDKFLQ